MKRYPLHFIVIIIFFLTHGYAENLGLLSLKDPVTFFLICVAISSVALLGFYFIFRSWIKAGIFTSFLLLLYLFFGAILDALQHFGKIHYRFLLPILALLVIIVGIVVARAKQNLIRVNFYLNMVFLIFIVYDLLTITFFSGAARKEVAAIHPTFNDHLTNCDSCNKPDIYFLLLDQYCGSSTLKKYTQYDNSSFETFLKAKGFNVVNNSTSNYPSTILSLTSMLNMSFVAGFTDSSFNAQDYARVLPLLRENIVTDYLTRNDYKFFNYSIFDIQQQPSLFTHHFFPSNMQLVLDKTLYERLKKDLFIDKKVGPFKIQFGIEWETQAIKKANAQAIQKTISTANDKSLQPKFVYTHLLMPHPPYLYDSVGRTLNKEIGDVPDSLLNSYYLNYLVYTNKVVSHLISDVMNATGGRAIIILMGDHGNKHFNPGPPPADRFATINAVYYPDRGYNGYYDGFSNVNAFRVLLNNTFHQKLPLLKDSTAFFHD
jgi:hypothetical protein